MRTERESLFPLEEQMGATLKGVALVESIHGPMTRACDVCRGGWWDKDDEALIRVHHSDCPRKDDE